VTAAVLTERDPLVLPARRYGGLTLDALISCAWAGLSGGAPVACPVCDGAMRPQPDSAAAACAACGAELS
jgi:hypothetical protein